MIFLPFPYIIYTSFNSTICQTLIIFFFSIYTVRSQPMIFLPFSLYNLLYFQIYVLSKTHHSSSFFKYTIRSNSMIFLLLCIISYIFKSTVCPKPISFLLLSNNSRETKTGLDFSFQIHDLSETHHFFLLQNTVCFKPMIFLPFLYIMSYFFKSTVCPSFFFQIHNSCKPMILLPLPYIISYIFKSTVCPKPIIFLLLSNTQFASDCF